MIQVDKEEIALFSHSVYAIKDLDWKNVEKKLRLPVFSVLLVWTLFISLEIWKLTQLPMIFKYI